MAIGVVRKNFKLCKLVGGLLQIFVYYDLHFQKRSNGIRDRSHIFTRGGSIDYSTGRKAAPPHFTNSSRRTLQELGVEPGHDVNVNGNVKLNIHSQVVLPTSQDCFTPADVASATVD